MLRWLPTCRRPLSRTMLFIATAAIAFSLSADRARADEQDGSAAAPREHAAAKSPRTEVPNAQIKDLIHQLGSTQFTVRREAASELQKIGPEAFDQLHAATDDSDPEIAASARYLLRQIVRWTRSDDSTIVRRLLRDYGDLEENERRARVAQLAALPNRDGLAGLCRVARFDRSSQLSRLAALAIVRLANQDAPSRPIDPEVIDRELGESTRVAPQWLRQYQIELRDPAASVAGWQQLVDAESKLLDANDDQTSPDIMRELLWNMADVYRRLNQTAPLVKVTDQIVVVSGDDADANIARILQWFVDHETWDALDQFAVKFDSRIQQQKRSLYLVALAHVKQGQTDAAEQLAARALKLDPVPPQDNLDVARALAGQGQLDWAVREYHQGFDDEPLESVRGIASRLFLSELLKDYERYDEAAAVTGPLASALESDGELRQQLSGPKHGTIENDPPHDKAPDEPDKGTSLRQACTSTLQKLSQVNEMIPDADGVLSRQHFLLACQFQQQHDLKQQREHLLQSIQHDESDADVLIAMYRAEDADEAWRTDVRKRIDKLARMFEQKIEENPTDDRAYNQYAWLIANTEGDYAKAVRYSRRSLELDSNNPGYQDTLGRCYYAAGDYEKAVKFQSEAVKQVPSMQVMKRQLKLFEKALAAQKAKGAGDGAQGAGKAEPPGS